MKKLTSSQILKADHLKNLKSSKSESFSKIHKGIFYDKVYILLYIIVRSYGFASANNMTLFILILRMRITGSNENSEHESEVWDAFGAEKCSALEAGRSVILDACHISEKARWHSVQGPNARHRKICIVFDLPLDTVRDRCLRAKRMPIKEVEHIWRAFKESRPTREELRRLGFDEVYFVNDISIT
jgi:predicted kinase